MTIQELEQLIEGQAESPGLDFKGNIPWEVKDFAKDFLAMSNGRDGGTLVIGVDEKKGSFIPVGVSPANAATFKVDEMRDQLASFCDPSPTFRVELAKDTTGRTFIVIEISPFRDSPLLSRKGIHGVILANTVYYRNTNKRVESAPISNSHDFRDLIELAARNLLQRRTELGYRLDSGIKATFDADRAAFPTDGLLATIRAAAFWEVEFQPDADMELENLTELSERVRKATIRLNWPFPYFSLSHSEAESIQYGDGYIEGFADHPYLQEFWRFYSTGHFLFYRKLQEDMLPGITTAPAPGTYVSYLNSIVNLITETVQFFSALAASGLYRSGGHLNLTLHNVRDRSLFLDGRLTPFMRNHSTSSTILRLSSDVTHEQLLDDPGSLSRKLILKVVNSFGFNPAPEQVKQLQENHLNRR